MFEIDDIVYYVDTIPGYEICRAKIIEFVGKDAIIKNLDKEYNFPIAVRCSTLFKTRKDALANRKEIEKKIDKQIQDYESQLSDINSCIMMMGKFHMLDPDNDTSTREMRLALREKLLILTGIDIAIGKQYPIGIVYDLKDTEEYRAAVAERYVEWAKSLSQ